AALVEDRLLELNRRGQSLDCTGEFHQHAVPSQLDDAAATPRQHWFEVLLSDGAQAADGAAFIPTHESGITNHVGSQDSRKSSLVTGQCNFPNSQYQIVEALERLGNEMAGHVTTGPAQWPARRMSVLGPNAKS